MFRAVAPIFIPTNNDKGSSFPTTLAAFFFTGSLLILAIMPRLQ